MPNRFASVLTACVLGSAPAAALAEPPSPPASTKAPTTVAPVTVTAAPRRAPDPKVISEEAHSFVRGAGAANSMSAMDQIGRWKDAVCVKVTGVIPAQAAAIKARIESVAEAVDLPAPPPGCRPNVRIVFTDRKPLRRAIQPFYDVRLGQNALSHHFIPTITFTDMVIVADSKALDGKSLGQVADYMTMLTLSPPKSLDHCASFRSVMDLYAKVDCPGRDALDGLTPADAAFLTALYKEDLEIEMNFERGDIARRMAAMLIKAGAVASAEGEPANPLR